MLLTGLLFYILALPLVETVTAGSAPPFESEPPIVGKFTHVHLEQLKNRTRTLFDHGWNSYMEHGYPADEIKPLTCQKYERTDDIHDIHRNDALGNYSVTFLDTLTTFAVFGDVEKFEKYVLMLKGMTSFDIDSTVQVFETSIRALGSLLSAHLYASDKFKLPNYDGFLLNLAYDLGQRLVTAYQTKSGIPLARVNLHDSNKQLPKDLIDETCTAGAASPMLELTLLSILSNNTIFEEKSREAFFTLWGGRSRLDLVPMSVDPINGKWLNAITGVGASIDSFYEYALKGAILFDDEELYNVWTTSYKAIATHSRTLSFLGNVHVESGSRVSAWIDSLSAFFPGLLVLAGEIEDAMSLHQPFIKLWNKYNGIPERWDFLNSLTISNSPPPSGTDDEDNDNDPISLEWYPLRPEFIESTYYLYQATRDPIYLRIGEAILNDYETIFKAPCGFSGFRDVRTLEMQDRMESFVLSETFMYLYLLFDANNELNKDGKFIFSTEGHPFWIPKGVLKQYRNFKTMSSELTSLESTPTPAVADPEQGRLNTVSAIVEKIKSWPGDEIANAAGIIKRWFEDNGGDHSETETAAMSTHVLEKLWLDSIGFELVPLKTLSCPVMKHGFFSSYLSRPDVFTNDALFWRQFDDSKLEMEVTNGFYEIFSPPNSYCDRKPETELVDYYFGVVSGSKPSLVEILARKDDDISEDLWVHDLNGLRIVFEVLKPNKVGYSNRLLQRDDFVRYYEGFSYDIDGICPVDDQGDDAVQMFAVRTINGINVGDRMVYVSPSNRNGGLMTSGVLKTTSAGCLVLNNIVVSNMVMWTV